MLRRHYRPAAQIITPEAMQNSFLQDVVIHFKENAHAIAELTVLYFIPKQAPILQWQYPSGITWGEQSPVHFRYRMFSGDVTGDFYGYVLSEEIVSSGTDPKYSKSTTITVRYTIIGMTFWMQSQQDKLWKQCAPSSIVRDISTSYGMRPVAENFGVQFDTQMQSSQSDWRFLSDTVAQRVSARLALDGASTLYFTQYTTPIPSANGTWPVFTLNKVPGVLDTLRSFQGVTGDIDPLGGYRYQQVANALSPSVPQVSYTPSRDLDSSKPIQAFKRRYTLWPGRTYTETKRYLVAESEPLWVYASATTDGDPRCKVGAVVELQGTGVAVDHQGKWLVRSATHKIHQAVGNPVMNTYTCDLVLGRNQPDRLHEPASPLDTGTDYGTVLIGNRWRAAYVSSQVAA